MQGHTMEVVGQGSMERSMNTVTTDVGVAFARKLTQEECVGKDRMQIKFRVIKTAEERYRIQPTMVHLVYADHVLLEGEH